MPLHDARTRWTRRRPHPRRTWLAAFRPLSAPSPCRALGSAPLLLAQAEQQIISAVVNQPKKAQKPEVRRSHFFFTPSRRCPAQVAACAPGTSEAPRSCAELGTRSAYPADRMDPDSLPTPEHRLRSCRRCSRRRQSSLLRRRRCSASGGSRWRSGAFACGEAPKPQRRAGEGPRPPPRVPKGG